MIRIGFGKDVHRLGEGRPLILGGVAVPSKKGLLGHSDADVVCHAIMDALLGAAALGDIGTHFPDSDDKYKNVSSLILLENVRKLIESQDWEIGNIDCVVIIQEPKIAKYIMDMRKNIAHVLQIDLSAVSIKATTTEGMGFEGVGNGVTAESAALLQKKDVWK